MFPGFGLFPFGWGFTASTPACTTTVEREPCPHCGTKDYVCKNKVFVCTSCGMSVEAATAHGPKKRILDEVGNLLCQKCGDGFPYAEPPASGDFVCRGCKLVQ